MTVVWITTCSFKDRSENDVVWFFDNEEDARADHKSNLAEMKENKGSEETGFSYVKLEKLDTEDGPRRGDRLLPNLIEGVAVDDLTNEEESSEDEDTYAVGDVLTVRLPIHGKERADLGTLEMMKGQIVTVKVEKVLPDQTRLVLPDGAGFWWVKNYDLRDWEKAADQGNRCDAPGCDQTFEGELPDDWQRVAGDGKVAHYCFFHKLA